MTARDHDDAREFREELVFYYEPCGFVRPQEGDYVISEELGDPEDDLGGVCIPFLLVVEVGGDFDATFDSAREAFEAIREDAHNENKSEVCVWAADDEEGILGSVDPYQTDPKSAADRS